MANSSGWRIFSGFFFVVLARAWQEYLANIKIAMAFVLLGVFVFFFVLFSNAFVSSGSVFFEYSLLKSGLLNSVFEIAIMLVYLLFFSLFLSVLIFAVRHDLNEVRMQHYLVEKLPKFVFTNFLFLLLFAMLAIAVSVLLLSVGVHVAIIAFVLLLVSIVFMFVPQSIVVDEERITNAVLNAVQFFFSNIRLSLAVLVISAALLFFIPLIEIGFDQFSFAGRFVSLLLVLVFVLPFIETLKTVAYLTKFELIKVHV